MADSDFVYLEGEPVDVGNAVENDFVFAGDQLVSDVDVSDFAFISDRGFGAGSVKDGRLTVYDGLSQDDPIIIELDFNINGSEAPERGTKVSVGFFSSDGNQEYDNIRTGDGTVIEDFDACNSVTSYFDSAYNGGDGSVSPSQDWDIYSSGSGCYLIEDNTGLASRVSSSVGYGLQNYPEWGDTILADVYVSSGKDAGYNLGGDARSPEFRVECNNSDSVYRIRGGWVEDTSINQSPVSGNQLWKVEFF